jgi:magnesium and cobalt exporter, CNNM family
MSETFQRLGALGFAFLIIVVNAFFVAAEFALVKVRRTRIDELARAGGIRARVAQQIVRQVDTYISATQLGITAANLALGWIGEPAFAEILLPVFQFLQVSESKLTHTISLAFAFSSMTALQIVIGELAPKTLSLRYTETIALNMAVPLRIFHFVFYPVLLALRAGADGFLALFGVSSGAVEEVAHSEEELRSLVVDSHRHGMLPGSTRKLLENVLSYRLRVARDVMLPRGDIAYLSLDLPWEENLRRVEEGRHTRYPLCRGDLDHVIGLIHVRDLFRALAERSTPPDMTALSREALFVAESRPLELLRRDFQASLQHMAIVVDEFGGTAGLVTLEDVLEEIVGEIRDEFDRGERLKFERTEAGLLIDGLARLDEVREQIELGEVGAPEKTIGGRVSAALGRLARAGDEVDLGGVRFRVVEMKGRRIAKLLACTPAPAVDQAV